MSPVKLLSYVERSFAVLGEMVADAGLDPADPVFIMLLAGVVSALSLEPLVKVLRPRVKRGLQSPPGWRLHRIGSFVFSQRTFAAVVEPVLSDMQIEYCEALKAGAPFRAMWVRGRGYVNFCICVSAQMPVSFIRVLVALWKAAGQ